MAVLLTQPSFVAAYAEISNVPVRVRRGLTVTRKSHGHGGSPSMPMVRRGGLSSFSCFGLETIHGSDQRGAAGAA